jgi:hypothetical protein
MGTKSGPAGRSLRALQSALHRTALQPTRADSYPRAVCVLSGHQTVFRRCRLRVAALAADLYPRPLHSGPHPSTRAAAMTRSPHVPRTRLSSALLLSCARFLLPQALGVGRRALGGLGRPRSQLGYERWNPLRALGILIGFAGCCFVVLYKPEPSADGSSPLAGNILFFINCLGMPCLRCSELNSDSLHSGIAQRPLLRVAVAALSADLS